MLILCPEYWKIPIVLFERLMKKYYGEHWAQKIDELQKCTIITIERDIRRDCKFLKVHNFYREAIKEVINRLPPKLGMCDIYYSMNSPFIVSYLQMK